MTLGLAPTYKSTIINRINIFSLTTFYIYIKLLCQIFIKCFSFIQSGILFIQIFCLFAMQKRSIRKLELDMFELLKSEHIHFSCNILNRVYIELENVHQNVINMRTCCNSERIFTINCILLGFKAYQQTSGSCQPYLCCMPMKRTLASPWLSCGCIPVYFAFQFQHVHLIKSGNGEAG